MWANITDNDTVEPLYIGSKTYSTITVSVSGDLGNGHLEIEGSADNITYTPIVIDINKDTKIKDGLTTVVKSRPLYIKPCPGGGANQDVTVEITLKGIGS